MEVLTPSRVVQLMDNLTFFKDFTKEEKRLIAEIKNSLARFKSGEYIIRQGAYEQSIYVLLKGRVNITKKEVPRAVINTLGPGDVFGEISSLGKRARTTNVIAKADVMVLKLHAEFFDKLTAELREKIKDQFLLILINRLDQMNDSVITLKSELEGIFHAEEQVKQNLSGVSASLTQIRNEVSGISDIVGNLIR